MTVGRRTLHTFLAVGWGCTDAETQTPDPGYASALSAKSPVGANALPPNERSEHGTQAARELRFQDEPWTGDFDGMVARRMIRVLVAPSRTGYFLDGVTQRGIAYEGSRLPEEWVNKELGTGALPVHVVLIPVTRDRRLPALTEGYGDVVSASLTITDARAREVDFSESLISSVRELVVTGPTAPQLETPDDLDGQEVYVRASSGYHDSLRALNDDLEGAGLQPVTLTFAEEFLEDEDLLEMVDAGLLSIIVVDERFPSISCWDSCGRTRISCLRRCVPDRLHSASVTARPSRRVSERLCISAMSL